VSRGKEVPGVSQGIGRKCGKAANSPPKIEKRRQTPPGIDIYTLFE
jgi:hypothetical protein